MSYIDCEDLAPADLVGQYVMSCRGKGLVLPYSDHQIIEGWLQSAPSADALLLLLSEILPAFYAKNTGQHPPPLRALDKKILSELRASKRHPAKALGQDQS